MRTIRDVLTSDREMAGTFYLGLVAHGIYITPYHLGFTNLSQTQTEIDQVLEVCQTVMETIKGD